TSDVATNNINITAQAAFASATGNNRTAGGINLNISTPIGLGNETFASVKRASFLIAQIGVNPAAASYGAIWLGNIIPASGNTTIESDGSTQTIIRGPAGGLLYFGIGTAGALDCLGVNSSNNIQMF